MFQYLRSFFSYLMDDDDADENLSLDDAYSILHATKDEGEEDEIPHDKEPEEFSCFRKSGIITAAKDGCFVIDDLYDFSSPFEDLQVGMRVSFMAYTSDCKLKVTDVVVQDDWSYTPQEMQGYWCTRSIICKVSKRDGRTVWASPGEICLNLDQVSSEFIPVVGDWLNVEAKVEVNENVSDLSGKVLEVEKIQPLRLRILEGFVKRWCRETNKGTIDEVIYFSVESLAPGYTPSIGDKVISQVIESDQGRCTYRALKVLPQIRYGKIKSLCDASTNNFFVKKEGISISSNIFIHGKKLGEVHTFVFVVSNEQNQSIVLRSIILSSPNCQCKITKPTVLTDIKIEYGGQITVEGVCTIKSMGVTKELVLFSFEDFNIGRWISINMESQQNLVERARYVDRGSMLLASRHFKQNYSTLIRGPKIMQHPRFVSARLPEYPIPRKLFNLFSFDGKPREEELRLVKPSFASPLSFNNYEERFHTLLHLEEISEQIAIKSYTKKCTILIKDGEFLLLEIENLSEQRPSLILGDKVLVKDAYDNNAAEYEGVIHKLRAKHICLKFHESFHDTYDGEDVSVIFIASRVNHRRKHQAVGLAVRNLGRKFLFPSKIEQKKPQVNFIYKLNDGKQMNRNERFLASLQNYNLQKKAAKSTLTTSESILKLEWFNETLNHYQKEAVKNILLGEVRPLPYLIFGPPGTGKTVTLVETILQLIKLIPHARLLVAAPSNSAVDLITKRLIDTGVLKPGDIIRLVAYYYLTEGKLPEYLMPYSATIDTAMEGTTDNMCFKNYKGLTLGCNSSAIGRHRVTLATCSTMALLINIGFSKGHFTHIIVDEAGQATEPEIMIPFGFLDTFSGQAILAGDPQQLGPIIISKLAVFYGLSETYLDRILYKFPYARDVHSFPETGGFDPRLVTRLLYNYRSLPGILSLPASLFYDGQLIPTISAEDSEEAQLLDKVKEILPCHFPVMFHGVNGENCQASDSPSWYNPNEASQVFFYVNELYRLGVKSVEIGIISPYLKQVRQIRALLAEAEFEVPKVGTVEEFQGQEYKVILLSTVRSSDLYSNYDLSYNLGFLSNARRVNVAITRAQALLIIVGNPNLLCRDPYWRSVIKYCVDNKSYCGCDLPKKFV